MQPQTAIGPLLTLPVHAALLAARRAGLRAVQCSLDLERSRASVAIDSGEWAWEGRGYPYMDVCKERTIYHWTGRRFEPAARFADALFKLVPTDWGPPTFEIDGIKMLPTAKASPYRDAESKVELIRPRGKTILDTCGGLGYFAAWCLHGGARRILSFEKSAEVIWLRSLNPWSPENSEPPEARRALDLEQADIGARITAMPDASVDAVLHDPPRFGIAGELYSQSFYAQLARVMRPHAPMFHYTGKPNHKSRGRELGAEVAARLRRAGFSVAAAGDGLLATRSGR